MERATKLLKCQNSALKRDKKELEATIEQLTNGAAELNKRIEELHRRIDDLGLELNRAHHENEKVQAQLEQSKIAHAKEISNIRSSLEDKYEKRIQDLQKQLAETKVEFEEEKEKLLKKNSKLELEIDEVRGKVTAGELALMEMEFGMLQS